MGHDHESNTSGSSPETEPQTEPQAAPRASTRKSHPFWKLFWLAFLALSLGYAWYSFYVPSNDVTWAHDIVSARQAAATTGKPMLLFFTADWCVPCRIMKREVFADPAVMTALNAKVVPVMVYAGEPGADEAFRQYNVGGTPVTIFTDSQGDVLDYAVGGIGKDRFMEMLEGIGAS